MTTDEIMHPFKQYELHIYYNNHSYNIAASDYKALNDLYLKLTDLLKNQSEVTIQYKVLSI
jgi:hypothetical protein